MLDYNMECKMIQKQHRQHVININIKKITDRSFVPGLESLVPGTNEVRSRTCLYIYMH